MAEENSYRRTQLENREQNSISKRLLGKRLKNDLFEMKVQKKLQQNADVAQQQIELRDMENDLKETANYEKIQNCKRKNELQNLYLNDLCQKEERNMLMRNADTEENNLLAIQNILTEKNRELIRCKEQTIRQKNLEKILKNQTKAAICSYPSKPEPKKVFGITPQSLLVHSKRSEIERKQEVHSKQLKKERIKMYEEQMRELKHKKEREKKEKQLEFEQRMLNLGTTASFNGQQTRDNSERMIRYQTIWSQQFNEKKLVHEKEILEDAKRLERLRSDMRKEDDKFLKDVNAMLNECVKQNKNTLPLINCVREFEDRKFETRNKIWLSQVPI